MKKHYKSVFENEQELLKAIIDIHLGGKDIELDPMFFKGNFYKNGIKIPKFIFDINPQISDSFYCRKGDATHLDFESEFFESIILDPPFLFGIHGKTKEYYSSKTHTIYETICDLISDYKLIIQEAYRLLKKDGILIFKCQDYTDTKTIMTHIFVYQMAISQGFYAKDIAILVKPNKITNPNTKQRHLRKIHTYFFVFQKKSR